MKGLDIWGALWPNNPKVHMKVLTDLSYQIWKDTPFGTIFTMVELAGVTPEEDVLVTARALRDLRNEWRMA